MSFNYNFYNFRGKSTFHNTPSFIPPQPLIPNPFFLPPSPQLTDEEFVKQFGNRQANVLTEKSQPSVSISKVHDEVRILMLALNEIKAKEKMLSEKVNHLSEDEWNSCLSQIEESKTVISEILSNMNNLNTNLLRKLLVKRSAKRLRQKRQRLERKKNKEELIKQKRDKSRKIDEFLQKFQDEMNKAKQEKEAKLQADAVLRETIRKKQDAKKYIVKLDALVKLHKARQNTAKGRGVNECEKEGKVFEKNIEKLKTMWAQRLEIYKKEEMELRTKLKQDSETDTNTNKEETEVSENLEQWKLALFGGELPQVNFGGNIDRFIAVRFRWDQYLRNDGTFIPVGWVPSTATNLSNLVENENQKV